MLQIPDWLRETFDKGRFDCPACDHAFNPEHVTVIGIKNVDYKKNGNRTMLYIEYMCPQCKQKVSYEIQDMTLEEFAAVVLDGLQEDVSQGLRKIESKKPTVVKNNKKCGKDKSKITLTEQKSLMKMLDDSDSWLDFLIKIGAPMDQAIFNRDKKR